MSGTKRDTATPRQTVAPPVWPHTRAVRIRVPPAVDRDWPTRVMEAAGDAGFNAVVIDAFFGGLSLARRSPRLVTVLGRIAPPNDLLGALCAEARDNRLFVYAGMSLLYLGVAGRYPRSPLTDNRRLLARNERQRPLVTPDSDDDHPHHLCPANPDVAGLLATLAAEIAAAYPVSGLLFDHIALPPGTTCHCRVCNAATESDTARASEAADPELPAAPMREHWDDTARLLCAIRTRVERLRRGIVFAGQVNAIGTGGMALLKDGLLDIGILTPGGSPMPPFDPTIPASGDERLLMRLLEPGTRIEWQARPRECGHVWCPRPESLVRADFAPDEVPPVNDRAPAIEASPVRSLLLHLDQLAGNPDLASDGRNAARKAAADLRSEPARTLAWHDRVAAELVAPRVTVDAAAAADASHHLRRAVALLRLLERL